MILTLPTERSFPWKKCVITIAPGRVSHKSAAGNLNSHVKPLGSDRAEANTCWVMSGDAVMGD